MKTSSLQFVNSFHCKHMRSSGNIFQFCHMYLNAWPLRFHHSQIKTPQNEYCIFEISHLSYVCVKQCWNKSFKTYPLLYTHEHLIRRPKPFNFKFSHVFIENFVHNVICVSLCNYIYFGNMLHNDEPLTIHSDILIWWKGSLKHSPWKFPICDAFGMGDLYIKL